jgi:hypothetical protein
VRVPFRDVKSVGIRRRVRADLQRPRYPRAPGAFAAGAIIPLTRTLLQCAR